MKQKEIFLLFGRYVILVVLGLFGLWIFYAIFTPLTIYPVNWVLDKIYGSYIVEGFDTIYLKGIYLNIIPACIAGSAYYLLLILNLTTPMKIEKRVKNILVLWGCFLALNILRIAGFAILFYSGYKYFDITHKAFWYFGSTIMVAAIWFGGAWLFGIREIPAYSDAKNIFKSIKR